MIREKKKIAILTQQLGCNYGGIIQNYALQKVVKQLGYNVITIDRADDNPHSKFKILLSEYKHLFYKKILNKNVVTFLDYRNICKTNIRFIKIYINKSPKFRSTSALKKYFIKEKFSAVIVGSDQVWRPIYSPNIYNYYLDFLQHRNDVLKIAYAASFGTAEWEYSEQEEERCTELIQQFDGVSVREEIGAKLCDDYLNRKDAILVLDPTLLLTAEDYSMLIKKEKQQLGLFTYILDQSDFKDEFVKKCASFLNLKHHYNQAPQSSNNIDTGKLSDYIIPPIEGWLQGFRDSEFIITDSFHGTAFAIINRKTFFVLVNKARGASRFESLLGQLGIEGRLIYSLEDFDYSRLNERIDHQGVNIKLDKLKEKSFQYIHKYF